MYKHAIRECKSFIVSPKIDIVIHKEPLYPIMALEYIHIERQLL